MLEHHLIREEKENEMKKIGFALILFFVVSGFAMANEFSIGFNRENYHKYLLPTALSSSYQSTRIEPEPNNYKTRQVIQTGRWIGTISGAGIGLLHLYWLSMDEGLTWKVAATGVPAIFAAAYVGMLSTEWATTQIMTGNPRLWEAALKGAIFGAIDGAIILSVSYLPFFITGHYLGTVHFNYSSDWIILKIIGNTILGGIGYGGLLGAIAGGISGPIISVYMGF